MTAIVCECVGRDSPLTPLAPRRASLTLTMNSAPHLEAAYGLLGLKALCSAKDLSSFSSVDSPYTSSVLTWMKRFTCAARSGARV